MRIIYYFIFISGILLILFACKSTDKPVPSHPKFADTQEVSPQAKMDPDDVCEQVLCRPETTINLQIDKDYFYDYEFGKTPYYYKKTLTILPEELLYLQLEIENDTIISAKIVEEITHPDSTLTFKFEQFHQADKDVHGMILSVVNPLAYNITYNAYLQKIDSSQPVQASTCPIISKKNGYELWSFPIVQLILKDFALNTQKPETINCR